MEREKLIKEVIDAAYKVYAELHPGFVESVYQHALVIELGRRNIRAEVERQICVYYAGQVAGNFRADVYVDDWLIVEVKAVKELSSAHEVQLVNYLTATNNKTGLLINFGGDKFDCRRKYNNRI